MSGLGQRTVPDQRIPIGGEAELHADVYLPHQAGRYPAVISFGAYSTEKHTAGIPTGSTEIGSPPVFTDRGYAPVIIERRGMGRSTGEQVPFFDPQDTDDHERAIAWAAEQPWCNGDRMFRSFISATPVEQVRELYAQWLFDLPVPPYLSRNTVHYGGASWIDVELVDRPST